MMSDISAPLLGFSFLFQTLSVCGWTLAMEEWLPQSEIDVLGSEIICQKLLPKTSPTYFIDDSKSTFLKEINKLKNIIKEKEILLEEALKTNQRLAQQTEALQSPNISDLITYLPLFFSNIWTKVKIADIACFVESQEQPKIPSPYQEPGIDCLYRLKRRFQQLPLPKQAAILDCCRDLQHQYTVRGLVRSLLDKNNGVAA